MNYLAHLTLSFDKPGLMVGNFVADFTRRKYYDTYPSAVRKGIELHHYIDSFTDSHPATERAKAALRPTQGKYSGVVLDIYYDHLLARNYRRFGREPLEAFAPKSYAVLAEAESLLPTRAAHTLHYMHCGDWLRAYASPCGMARSLEGMSRRAGFDNAMAHAADDFSARADFFEASFEQFYPELENAVAQWLKVTP